MIRRVITQFCKGETLLMWQKNTWVKLTDLKVLKNAMTSPWSFMYTYQAQLSTHFSDVYSFCKECLLKN